MILKTSLFNFGIYRSTIHRFKWGSFLYFIILFFSVPFVLMTRTPAELLERYNPSTSFLSGRVILGQSFMTVPYLLALVVPTIVALLIFHNVHSSKQGVFTHSIPVTRKAYYISSILGGFSLMLAPVLLNGIILLAMSFFGYGKSVTVWSVGVWIAVNAAVLFIMFAAASFSAFLTGDGVAHAFINVLLHTFPLLVALAIALVSEIFLFGFQLSADSFIAERIYQNTPLIWLFRQMTFDGVIDLGIFKSAQLWIYISGAAAVYVLAYLLYKNRKIEVCGDVTAFKVFRPIFKYTVTSAAALAVFAMLWAMELSAAAIFIVAAVLSAVVYFVCEMLMTKTFKVFGTYKGFAGFAVCVALVIGFCAYTNVFGYETRIPDEDKIAKAAVFKPYYGEHNEPLLENREAISAVRAFHKELIQDIPVTERSADTETVGENDIRIKYILKNGRSLERLYKISQEQYNKALAKMYEFTDYKLKVTRLDIINTENNLKNANLEAYASNFSYNISLNDEAAEVLSAVKRDIERLSFEEINQGEENIKFHISFSLTKKENEEQKVFKEGTFAKYDIAAAVQSFDIMINSNFTDTMDVLKQKGHLNTILESYADGLWICKEPFYKAGDMCTYKDDKGYFGEFYASINDCIKLNGEDSLRLAEELLASTNSGTSDGKNYFVFSYSKNDDGTMWFINNATSYLEEKLPDYLEKYIKK